MKKIFSRYYQWIAIATVLWLAIIVLSSSHEVRGSLSSPLVVHEQDARGDLCYILAGGSAIWERLDAAADLSRMGRVPGILLMRDNSCGQYSFKAKTSWTRTQWFSDYLTWRGIPSDRISWIPQAAGLFGTLQEARNVARHLPRDVKTLVVVSSAPHMRRVVLAFKRALPENVRIVPYAATSFELSYEMYHPIWIEYLKLLVYFVVA